MGFSTKIVPEQCGFHIVRCFLSPKNQHYSGTSCILFLLFMDAPSPWMRKFFVSISSTWCWWSLVIKLFSLLPCLEHAVVMFVVNKNFQSCIRHYHLKQKKHELLTYGPLGPSTIHKVGTRPAIKFKIIISILSKYFGSICLTERLTSIQGKQGLKVFSVSTWQSLCLTTEITPVCVTLTVAVVDASFSVSVRSHGWCVLTGS